MGTTGYSHSWARLRFVIETSAGRREWQGASCAEPCVPEDEAHTDTAVGISWVGVAPEGLGISQFGHDTPLNQGQGEVGDQKRMGPVPGGIVPCTKRLRVQFPVRAYV